MIDSKSKYAEFLYKDRVSLGLTDLTLKHILFNEIYQYQYLLRTIEYYINCKKNWYHKPVYYFYKYLFKKWSLKLGFSISPNCFDSGLCIGHYGYIVINGRVKIGKNCSINPGVVLGENHFDGSVPTLGDDIYIAPGVKIIGNVSIANGVTLAANTVVTKDILEPYTTWGGIPAKKISERSIKIEN